MNAWSVLAGLLVTIGAGAGAIYQTAPLDALDPQTTSSDEGTILEIPGVIEVRDEPSGGEDGNATEGGEPAQEGNATQPPEEPVEAQAASNGTCSCVFIEDWGDGVGPTSDRWSFPVSDSNTQLSYWVDAGSTLRVAGGFTMRLFDGDGQVVAERRASGVEVLGGYGLFAGEILDPSPGVWTLEVESDDLWGSYSVSVATAC